MQRQTVATSLLRTTLTQMAGSPDGSNPIVLNILYNVCACVLALLLGTALMKQLCDYIKRKGYIEIQQDDRGMFSNVLMGTSDSWEHLPATTDDAAI
ncbi:unnamed protein product [Peronospora belbahrii]|uniref:Uncharacterized protein n=1 Tax=Peronospora belbahrii TaxID=622444 RepID=A0AAU9KJP0_9STRA|nr:unnamed protein product [Peronospora belbahrii]CAH0521315.1 unnamed protein product [Peronospora belbahrii]